MKAIYAVPATLALVYRAWSRQSLTPLGIAVATVTAVAHAIHPWSVFFVLLTTFFLAGTAATKVKHEVKARLTQSATGAGGEGPRNHVQVLANSLVASVLILLHAWIIKNMNEDVRAQNSRADCWKRGSDVLVVGIVANYAAVTADTFSSELGILATSAPRLITAPWREVPRGTNGGVTMTGLRAGFGGALLIAVISAAFLPWCDRETGTEMLVKDDGAKMPNTVDGTWSSHEKLQYVAAMTFAGVCGTLLDSILGALLQASVIDTKSGRIVEGEGGGKVLVEGGGTIIESRRAHVRSEVGRGDGGNAVAKTSALSEGSAVGKKRGASGSEFDDVAVDARKGSRVIEVGRDLLDNNAVNFLMAASISVGAMVAATVIWDLPLTVATLLS